MLEFLFVVGPVRNWQKIYISNKNGQAYFRANENVFCKTVEIEYNKIKNWRPTPYNANNGSSLYFLQYHS
jgi:hypothetical protein